MVKDAPVAAVLLAAGNSLRMGRSKPLLEWRGETFLERQIRLYREAGCVVYIVLGRDAEKIAAVCPAVAQAVLLLNPEPDRGMLSSLKIGLAALPEATPAVLFSPVDNPGVRPETVRSILGLWRNRRAAHIPSPLPDRRGSGPPLQSRDREGAVPDPTPIPSLQSRDRQGAVPEHPPIPAFANLVIPRHGGRRGHPVLLDGQQIPALLAWPDESTPRDFIHSLHHAAAWADVDDANVTLDIDSPAEYEAFLLQQEDR